MTIMIKTTNTERSQTLRRPQHYLCLYLHSFHGSHLCSTVHVLVHHTIGNKNVQWLYKRALFCLRLVKPRKIFWYCQLFALYHDSSIITERICLFTVPSETGQIPYNCHLWLINSEYGQLQCPNVQMLKVLFQGRFFDKEKDTVAKWIHKNETGQKCSQYVNNRSNHFAFNCSKSALYYASKDHWQFIENLLNFLCTNRVGLLLRQAGG
jgi:hypothetical protein